MYNAIHIYMYLYTGVTRRSVCLVKVCFLNFFDSCKVILIKLALHDRYELYYVHLIVCDARPKAFSVIMSIFEMRICLYRVNLYVKLFSTSIF